MAGDTGFEPVNAAVKGQCLTAWRIPIMARPQGFEPRTLALEGRCSIQLSYERIMCLERVKGVEPSQLPWKGRALPLSYTRGIKMVVEEGFEPSKTMSTDLQSVPFDHSGTPPRYWS